ncbi:MAG TPA: hypothetical protein VN907_05245, partial [Actinomycetes bacterium]|nr:hypothetical protein [Actinomycetes bacterium]
ALTTAVPPLQQWILPLSLLAIALIAWANLAGVRESGRIFAVPTYLFVGSCGLMLLAGLGRQLTGHLAPFPPGRRRRCRRRPPPSGCCWCYTPSPRGVRR